MSDDSFMERMSTFLCFIYIKVELRSSGNDDDDNFFFFLSLAIANCATKNKHS